MWQFLQSYGLWILLGLIFVAMQRFGSGCGGHDHGPGRGSEAEKESKRKKGGAGQASRRQCGE